MSGLSLQSPYVVATLPRPVDTTTGKYVCAEVHGSEPGSRKRKRELAIGIDGEGVNLYDFSTSKLITSYALPPQSAFTCAPCSIKSRRSRKLGYQRRTYTSTVDSTERISLFKDVTSTDGNTQSTLVKLESKISKSPVIFLDTVAGADGCDLLVVRKDGEVQCLDGDNLQSRWTSPSTAVPHGSTTNQSTVEFCQIIDAYSANLGLFNNRPDILSTFPDIISQTEYNPDLLVMITNNFESRTLHVFQLPRSTVSITENARRSVQSVLSIQLAREDTIKFELHAASGVLYVMGRQRLSIYDMRSGVTKLQSQLNFKEQATFLRLSSTSVVSSSSNKVDIYNPKFGSTQASVGLSEENPDGKRKAHLISEELRVCDFICYSKSQNIIHAIRDNELLAFQVDVRLNGAGSRSLGLLIDSIGHGEGVHPGDIDEEQRQRTVDLDHFAAVGDVESYERIMSEVLGIERDQKSAMEKSIPDWIWPQSRHQYADVNPAWIRYALSKIFRWRNIEVGEDAILSSYKLVVSFYPHNVVRWLIETGNLNKANIESALRTDLLLTGIDDIPAGQTVDALVEVDPGMNALFSFISNTYVPASEITHAVRVLMGSLELFTVERSQTLLDNDDVEMQNGDHEVDDTAQELQDAEAAANADLALAEFHLGDGSTVRGQALSVAIAKLHLCPTPAIVQALKSTFSSPELIAFIYLLRFELARGSWTSRYLDLNVPEDEATEAQDSNIILVTDLLNNCVDAVGSGGWLADETMLASGDQFDSEELVKGLKLEVSAALQGIEEAAYLRGLTSEMIRYGEAVLSAAGSGYRGPNPIEASSAVIPGKGKSDNARAKKDRPILIPAVGKDSAILPIGLKVSEKISLSKVGAGGEVTRRTARDIGRLKSRKVPKYSTERILI